MAGSRTRSFVSCNATLGDTAGRLPKIYRIRPQPYDERIELAWPGVHFVPLPEIAYRADLKPVGAVREVSERELATGRYVGPRPRILKSRRDRREQRYQGPAHRRTMLIQYDPNDGTGSARLPGTRYRRQMLNLRLTAACERNAEQRGDD